MIALVSLLLFSCGPEITGKGGGPVDAVEAEGGDGFALDTSIRITSPSQGASVSAPITARFSAGADVTEVRVELDGAPYGGFIDPGETISATIEADAGRHTIGLVAYDDRRGELSRDEVLVSVVDDEGSWVTIVTPTDGSHPVNPVQFALDASDDVAWVELFADGWTLGTTAPDAVLTYTFTGTGYERIVQAVAMDEGGEEVARDEIAVTVEGGDPVVYSDFNQMVLDLIETYPSDGTYTYYWPQTGSWSGSTRDLYYQGERIADDGGYSSCYCSGITWELFFRAWQEWDRSTGGDGDDLNGLDPSDVMTMRTDWYVRDLDGPGPSVALAGYGLGYEVASFDDWEPGDFVQLWRTSGSGHTAVFMGWIEDAHGNRLGMDYVSCQGSTDGFGLNDEYFGTHSGAMDPLKMYAGRAVMPDLWY